MSRYEDVTMEGIPGCCYSEIPEADQRTLRAFDKDLRLIWNPVTNRYLVVQWTGNHQRHVYRVGDGVMSGWAFTPWQSPVEHGRPGIAAIVANMQALHNQRFGNPEQARDHFHKAISAEAQKAADDEADRKALAAAHAQVDEDVDTWLKAKEFSTPKKPESRLILPPGVELN